MASQKPERRAVGCRDFGGLAVPAKSVSGREHEASTAQLLAVEASVNRQARETIAAEEASATSITAAATLTDLQPAT